MMTIGGFVTVEIITTEFEPIIKTLQKITVKKEFATKLCNEGKARDITFDENIPVFSEEKLKLDLAREQAKFRKVNNISKPIINLPHKEMDLRFIYRLAHFIKQEQVGLFFEPSTNKIAEITEWKNELKNRYIFGKKIVDALRIKCIIEEKFNFMGWTAKKGEEPELVERSPSKSLIDTTMSADTFRESLRKLNGVFESPFLYIKDNQLKVTTNGYNEDCQVFIRKDAPQIFLMDIDLAKKWINDCLIDFPFQSEQDKVVAISSIITPMLRGIYNQYGVRTPAFCWLGNQQGCGKDYGAGIRHIIYTGRFDEDSPLSNDKGSNSEEVEKQFVSYAMTGQQFMHNSNCRGHLANASYEKQLTAQSIRGRALGTNIMIDAENILECSFSGNYGLSFNKDIGRRVLFINLFTEVEDTTKRKFTKNLHQWILENRNSILSAIYTLIKSWWDAGHKLGEGTNASYPVWAQFCSGVMQYHNLGDPCASVTIALNDIGGDNETKNISLFNREMGNWLYDEKNIILNEYVEHKSKGLVKKEIFALYEKIFADSDEKPFGYFDLNTPKDRQAFGKTLNKYLGTYRGGYKLMIADDNQKKLDRIKFKFVPVVPIVPSVPSPHTVGILDDFIVGGNNGTSGTSGTHFDSFDVSKSKKVVETYQNIVKQTNNAVVSIDELKELCKINDIAPIEFDTILTHLLNNGDIFSPKSGFVCQIH